MKNIAKMWRNWKHVHMTFNSTKKQYFGKNIKNSFRFIIFTNVSGVHKFLSHSIYVNVFNKMFILPFQVLDIYDQFQLLSCVYYKLVELHCPWRPAPFLLSAHIQAGATKASYTLTHLCLCVRKCLYFKILTHVIKFYLVDFAVVVHVVVKQSLSTNDRDSAFMCGYFQVYNMHVCVCVR